MDSSASKSCFSFIPIPIKEPFHPSHATEKVKKLVYDFFVWFELRVEAP
jgi:hypothetical protein